MKNRQVVYVCRNKSEYDLALKHLHDLGCRWGAGDSLMPNLGRTYIKKYIEELFVDGTKVTFGQNETALYRQDTYEVIEASKLRIKQHEDLKRLPLV